MNSFIRIAQYCQCGMPHGVTIFEKDDCGITLHFQLSAFVPWWKRLWLAMRYVCYANTKATFWDCVVLSDKSLPHLKGMIEEHLRDIGK